MSSHRSSVQLTCLEGIIITAEQWFAYLELDIGCYVSVTVMYDETETDGDCCWVSGMRPIVYFKLIGGC